MIDLPSNEPTRLQAREKLTCHVLDLASQASIALADRIADLIRSKQTAGQSCVLGLATGSSPVGVYNELVRLHREEGLSFANVVTFSLDEYYPLGSDELQSYARFIREHLLDHIDIPAGSIHIPD